MSLADLNPAEREALQQLFADVINPALARHDGRAELAGVEGTAVLVRLGGRCQGCAMAAVTLKQGLEVKLKEAVPRLSAVIDVTDHAQGKDPYYTPGKAGIPSDL